MQRVPRRRRSRARSTSRKSRGSTRALSILRSSRPPMSPSWRKCARSSALRRVALLFVQLHGLLHEVVETECLRLLGARDLHMAHLVAVAFEDAVRILHLGAAPEAEREMVLRRLRPRERSVVLPDRLSPLDAERSGGR